MAVEMPSEYSLLGPYLSHIIDNPDQILVLEVPSQLCHLLFLRLIKKCGRRNVPGKSGNPIFDANKMRRSCDRTGA
jgi:hypothetical protein